MYATSRSARIPSNDPHYETLKCRYHTYVCAYNPGILPPLEQQTDNETSTVQKAAQKRACTARIQVNARKSKNLLEVTIMDPLASHVHERCPSSSVKTPPLTSSALSALPTTADVVGGWTVFLSHVYSQLLVYFFFKQRNLAYFSDFCDSFCFTLNFDFSGVDFPTYPPLLTLLFHPVHPCEVIIVYVDISEYDK